MPMTLRLLHTIGPDTPEDTLHLLNVLLRGLGNDFAQSLLVIGPTPEGLQAPPHVQVHRIGARFGASMGAVLEVRRLLRRLQPNVVHATSGSDAATIRAAMWGAAGGVLTTIADPDEASGVSRWFRSSELGEIACSSQTIQRRLVEAGVPMGMTAVVRPPVDFGMLRAARERNLRDELGIAPAARVLVTPSPPTRAGGQFYAIWAMAILHQIWPDAVLIVPGVSREADRLRRLMDEIYCPQAFRLTGNRYTAPELLSIATALLVPAVGDVPTGWIAWAMAAGVPVIGSAVPSIAEFIADRYNGYLCRAAEPHTLAIRIRSVLESPQLREIAEVARGQAYDVFRSGACIEQYSTAFRRLAAGQRAVEALRDTAQA